MLVGLCWLVHLPCTAAAATPFVISWDWKAQPQGWWEEEEEVKSVTVRNNNCFHDPPSCSRCPGRDESSNWNSLEFNRRTRSTGQQQLVLILVNKSRINKISVDFLLFNLEDAGNAGGCSTPVYCLKFTFIGRACYAFNYSNIREREEILTCITRTWRRGEFELNFKITIIYSDVCGKKTEG